MHMADALISTSVGGTLWAASGAMLVYSSRKLKADLDERKAPLMGVLGAFIFSAQMINFSIPGTGSSGHLGGAMILAILLGPHAAFLTIASVLTVQALFFADGGLLALGCNMFNMGFLPCFIVYPLVYRPIAGASSNSARIMIGATLSGIVALQLGALAVVLQTVVSGISELPFATFAVVMLPIHLAIGLVEGLATFGIVSVLYKARPELLTLSQMPRTVSRFPLETAIIALGMATLLTAGLFSAFASSNPDGLEWSIAKTSGQEELAIAENSVAAGLAGVQEKASFLPDYGFKDAPPELATIGTGVAGVTGAALTLAMVTLLGLMIKRRLRAART